MTPPASTAPAGASDVSRPPGAAEGRGARRRLDFPAATASTPHSGGAPEVFRAVDVPHMQPESATSAAAPAPHTPVPLPGAVATAPAAPVDALSAPAPAPAATAAQLVAPITTVHRRGVEGTHTLTVEITPEALGPVRISVELRDGNVELQLAGHSEAARDALRAALPELRRALEAAGVGSGSFQVSPEPGGGQPQNNQAQNNQPHNGGHPQNGHARPAWAGPEGRASDPEPAPTPVARTGGSSLDLQL